MDTIRIIHNLPRSGGSIISKSISAQKYIILLSEIHPEGPKIIKKRGTEAKFADPLYQFQNWYKLFSTDELKKIEKNNLNFLQKILTINNKVKDQNKILVIRDWSFIDYLGQPYIDPINKNTLFELLNKQFDVKNLFIIRDPLEMFLSCLKNLDFFPKNYSFDKFLDGYDYFIKDISLDNTITFEKFTSDPDKTLNKIRTNVVVRARKSEELSKRISRATKQFKKAFQNQDVLLSDIYATELECLVESYEKNGKNN